MRVADYMMSFVSDRLKVDTVFMVSGGGIMHLTDAIACHGSLRYVCSHNEQATTMEADGYAKARGGFGVALVTTGPGATNALTGVVGAWQDSTPLFVISGQAKRQQTIQLSGLPLRQFGVQEADILPMVRSVTKYSVMLDDPRMVRYQMEKAMYLAQSGRPGPVWLDVPLDVQGAQVDPDALEGFDPEREGLFCTGDDGAVGEAIAELAAGINKAQRPVFVAGHGVRIGRAVEQFRALAEALNIPVTTPRLGIDIMDSGHPLYVGRPGIKGDRAGNFALQNADLVIALGTRLSINVTGHEYDKFARAARVVVVDVDEVEHKKPTIRVDRFIRCDALAFVAKLAEQAEQLGIRKGDEWPDICRGWKGRYPVFQEEYRQQRPINTYLFTELLSEQMNGDDCIVIDSGSSSYVVSQGIRIKSGQRYLASGGLGAMGYALPAALGASVARGGKRVVCITGDGSLQMNLQELLTIAHENLPVKIFIFNNHGYASIKTTQHNYFQDRFVGVDHKSGVALPDILKVAELYGIKGVRLSGAEGLAQEIAEVLECDGPVLVDVDCSQDQLIIPTVFSKKREDGSMVSLPLEDMYPFLDREEFKAQMLVPILPESL